MVSEGLLVVGDPLLDIIIPIESRILKKFGIEEGGCTPIDERGLHKLKFIVGETNFDKATRCAGGSAGNLGKAIAQLSPQKKVSFWGGVGQDKEGKAYAEVMKGSGVEMLGPHFSSRPTGCVICMVGENGERTMRTLHGAANETRVSHWAKYEQVLSAYRHVHIEGYYIRKKELFHAILCSAKMQGLTSSIDLSSFELVRQSRDDFVNLLTSQDVSLELLFCNEAEAKAFCQVEDIEDCVPILRQYAKTIVVTLGSKGCIAVNDQHSASVCPPKVKCVDTTGAGDFFTAGFLCMYMKGGTLEKACQLGCQLGSMIVQNFGTNIDREKCAQLLVD